MEHLREVGDLVDSAMPDLVPSERESCVKLVQFASLSPWQDESDVRNRVSHKISRLRSIPSRRPEADWLDRHSEELERIAVLARKRIGARQDANNKTILLKDLRGELLAPTKTQQAPARVGTSTASSQCVYASIVEPHLRPIGTGLRVA